MPLLTQRPKPLSPDELEKYLEVMIKKLLEKKPALAKDPKVTNELINESIKLLNEKFINVPDQMTLQTLRNPNFVRQLALCLTLTAELKQDKALGKTLNNALDNLIKNPAFLKEFQKIGPKDIDASSKLDKLLDKFLNKEQKEQLKDALKKVNQFFDKAFGLNKDKENDKGKNSQPDEYVNLYGIINSKITGGLAVPVFINLGTRDFIDQNPNNGYAPIDHINDTNDTSLGDSNSTNDKARQNFSQIAGTLVSTNLAEKIGNDLDDVGLKPSNAPTLKRG